MLTGVTPSLVFGMAVLVCLHGAEDVRGDFGVLLGLTEHGMEGSLSSCDVLLGCVDATARDHETLLRETRSGTAGS